MYETEGEGLPQFEAGGLVGSLSRGEDARYPDLLGKKCFVVIPYGKRKDRDGVEHDFERVFDVFIKPVVQELGIDCQRSKDRAAPGLIHKSMIEQILDWDLCIADITTGNANVFYELGIRHTARPFGTVIIQDEAGPMPFNIGGMRAISYKLDDVEALHHAKQVLRDAIVTALVDRGFDSLVHQIVPGLNVSRKSTPIMHREKIVWQITSRGSQVASAPACKRIGFITGDITNVEGVDIWVNPESTHMKMARMHDDSVSANIRYFGSKRAKDGTIADDTIAKELEKIAKPNGYVEAGTVIVTGSGRLEQISRVRKIFHVAAQHGEPGRGYVTVRSIENCVRGCLEEADQLNNQNRWWKVWRDNREFRSIIFPLFGTQSQGRDSQSVADRLFEAAIAHLNECEHSGLETVYFLAYTDRDRGLCETALNRLKQKRLVSQPGAKEGA